jgi:hypothetical protein
MRSYESFNPFGLSHTLASSLALPPCQFEAHPLVGNSPQPHRIHLGPVEVPAVGASPPQPVQPLLYGEVCQPVRQLCCQQYPLGTHTPVRKTYPRTLFLSPLEYRPNFRVRLFHRRTLHYVMSTVLGQSTVGQVQPTVVFALQSLRDFDHLQALQR